jgi:mRNA-degrading endonuclease RelE of RelBE toxin-antitoxin system
MDKIAKLLKKISSQDRTILLDLIQRLIINDKKLAVIKLKNSDLYRLRHGHFRIIFHKDNGVVIDSVRLRNDNTYKNL